MRAQFIHEKDVIELFDKVINDESVKNTFNLAPDNYSDTKDLSNGEKMEIYSKIRIPSPESRAQNPESQF